MPGKGLGIAIADYDHDGDPDIFVANDSMPEFLFHNKRNRTFEEVGLQTEFGHSTRPAPLLTII
jgi:enediyne biosynthesis protein E4